MAKSLQSEFVKYYKEKLEPLGFKKVKGRQPYFVRVINNEILHVFTFIGAKSTEYGYKAFHLVCGVATVYRKEINFSVPPSHNGDWLIELTIINEKKESEYPTVKLPRKSMKYYYNDENITEVIAETYYGAKIIIEELDKVNNMNEALRYFQKYNTNNIMFIRSLDDSFFDEEGLFYIRKEFDYKVMDEVFDNKRKQLQNSELSNEEKIIRSNNLLEWENGLRIARNEFIDNDSIYSKGMKLLNERYNTNIDKLIKYGLTIKKQDLEF